MKTPSRDLAQLLEQIIGMIPEDAGADVLKRRLKDRLDSVGYTSPEVMPHRWRQCQRILWEETPQPEEWPEWVIDIMLLWAGDNYVLSADKLNHTLVGPCPNCKTVYYSNVDLDPFVMRGNPIHCPNCKSVLTVGYIFEDETYHLFLWKKTS